MYGGSALRPKWPHQDGRHSAVALLLKAALIQVRNYMLLGASGFKSFYNRMLIFLFFKS
jgi:hypothetical protein